MSSKTKYYDVDIHFQALCNAIEHEKVDKVRSILDHHYYPSSSSSATPVSHDFDSVNRDGFTPLELSFLVNHRSIWNLLLRSGFSEGHHFTTPTSLLGHLNSLITESKKQVDKFGQLIKAAVSSSATLSLGQLKECEKQQILWQKRLSILKKMRMNLETSGTPYAPESVTVSVIRKDSIRIEISEPSGSNALYTKFQVQLSFTDTFVRIAKDIIVSRKLGVGPYELIVDDLREGQKYYVRASFGNLKGFGPYLASTPIYVVPSTWQNSVLSSSSLFHRSRYETSIENCVEILRKIVGDDYKDGFSTLKSMTTTTSTTTTSATTTATTTTTTTATKTATTTATTTTAAATATTTTTDILLLRDKKMKIPGLLQFFSGDRTPKFQRVLSRKLYLSCVLFHEDKVLMTSEDVLPILEVDDEEGYYYYYSNYLAEFRWFAKVTYIWRDLERLKLKYSSSSSTSTSSSIRLKLLTASIAMQNALGVTDLGSLYYKPFRHESDGSVVFSLVNHVKTSKGFPLGLKWVPLSKTHRRYSVVVDSTVEDSSVDLLRSSIHRQVLFQQVSHLPLSKGLYLLYVQTIGSVQGSMDIVVSNTSPNVLPYCKVRDNNHVTREEWDWILNLGTISNRSRGRDDDNNSINDNDGPSPTTNFLAGEGEEGSETTQIRKSVKKYHPSRIQFEFGRRILDSFDRLFTYLDVKESNRNGHRIYESEIFEISTDISVILILPSSDTVSVLTDSVPIIGIDPDRHDFLTVPLPIFELMHLSTYKRKILEFYTKTNLFLDIELVIAKQSTREAFSTDEIKRTQTYLTDLNRLSNQCDESWKRTRWIFDVLTRARDKTVFCGISYSAMKEWYSAKKEYVDNVFFNDDDDDDDDEDNDDDDDDVKVQNMLMNIHNNNNHSTRSDPSSSFRHFKVGNNTDGKVTNFPEVRLPYQVPPSASSPAAPAASTPTPVAPTSTSTQSTPGQSLHTLPTNPTSSTQSSLSIESESVSSNENEDLRSNVLQVFAAYETGLAPGTSVKIQMTTSTTSREVIDLVVKQLNMAVLLKGKDGPVYEHDKLNHFCLVAVIGSRERCLRDDFHPLQLQNPWRKGRLFIRMKNDLLAAIEHISRHSTIL